jgi:hypothetical protein
MQTGGSQVMLELRNLAIPFALLLAKNGLDHIIKSKGKGKSPKAKTVASQKPKAKAAVKSKSVPKTRGGCGCNLPPVTQGGATIESISNQLTTLMKSYV